MNEEKLDKLIEQLTLISSSLSVILSKQEEMAKAAANAIQAELNTLLQENALKRAQLEKLDLTNKEKEITLAREAIDARILAEYEARKTQ